MNELMHISWHQTPKGTLPTNLAQISAQMGTKLWHFRRIFGGKLGNLWPEIDGRRVNKKMYEIGQEFEKKQAQLSEAGKKGNRKRWGGESGGETGGDRNPDSDTDKDLISTTYTRGNSAPPASGPARKAPPASLEECKPWQSRETAHFLKKLPEKERTEKYPSLAEHGFHVNYIKLLIGPS